MTRKDIEVRQQTFDDTECVLSPQNKENIVEPWNSKIDLLKTALERYDYIQERKRLVDIFNDPLF